MASLANRILPVSTPRSIRKTGEKSASGPEKSPESSQKNPQARKQLLRQIATWGIFVLLIAGFAFFRYGYGTFFPDPTILTREFEEGPFEVSPEGAFVVPFDQRMQKETVEQAISITPHIPHQLAWNGKTLLVKPRQKLTVDQHFEVLIENSAKSIFGQPLDKKYQLSFTVGRYPSITNIFPEGELIQPDERILILFSHPMVSDQVLQEQQAPDFIQLTPFIEGDWIWHNSKTLAFHPLEGFPGSTRLQLSNTKVLQTRDSTEITDQISRTFETERLQRLPNEDEQVLAQDEHYAIRFNQPVDIRSLKRFSTLRDSNGKKLEELQYTQSKDQPNEYWLKAVETPWMYDETYTLTLSEELPPKSGNLTLGKEDLLEFATATLLKTGFEKEGTLYWNENSISIIPREDIPIERLRQAIQIIPDIPFKINRAKEGYELVFDELSQKRENMTLYITDDINTTEQQLVSHVIEYQIKNPPQLNISIVEAEQKICVYASNPLQQESHLADLSASQQKKLTIASEDDEECSVNEQLPHLSFVEKRFFQPEQQFEVTAAVTDIWGQQATAVQLVETGKIRKDNLLLQRTEQLFYQMAPSPEELMFAYQTKNIERLKAVVCKISADQAIEIETSYEQRWFSFDPSPEKCLRYNAQNLTLEPQWGEVVENSLRVTDFITDDLDTGLYYVYLQAPGLADEDGNPIETNIMLQYSHWNMLSKRGESSLVWLIDSKERTPIRRASLQYFSNDGAILESSRTNDDGIAFQPNNLLKHDFILAKKGTEELLLDVFSREGFEPSRFGVAYNVDESPYLYQFYLEDPNRGASNIEGVFIIKERVNGELKAPQVSSAVVSLYDEQEHLLWRKHQDIDQWGNLSFNINPASALLDGEYQLSVCLGLHQGVCHGTHFWTPVKRGRFAQQFQPVAPEAATPEESEQPSYIQIASDETPAVGNTVKILLEGLQEWTPALVTVERDAIHSVETIIPKNRIHEISLEVTDDMVPEVFVTVTQFGKEELIYDIERLAIDLSHKNLRAHETPPEELLSRFQNEALSMTVFSLESYSEENNSIREAFYPELGTSIVTAGVSGYANRDHRISSNSNPSPIDDVVLVRGEYLPSELLSEESFQRDEHQLVLLHDNSGRMESYVLGDQKSSQQIEVSTSIPPFLRPGDKVVLELDMRNTEDSSKNLQVFTAAEQLKFPLGERFFVGIPAQSSQTLLIPSQINAHVIHDSSRIMMSFSDHQEVLAEREERIPVEHYQLPLHRKKIMTYQAKAQQGNIELDMSSPGRWIRRVVVAPSPVSFAVENLKESLQRESLTLNEAIQKVALATHYSTLLGEESEVVAAYNTQESIANELSYLESRQKPDGGWSNDPEEVLSDVDLTCSLAKSLSVLVHAGVSIPDSMKKNTQQFLKAYLDEQVNERFRNQTDIETIGKAAMRRELKVLNALSSLTPSGISYANKWYNHRQVLDNESLVLLLLTLEDYRDAQVQGMNFKIEELIQILTSRREKVQESIWLESDLESPSDTFLITSWYLESLVRQASAHSDIPAVIKWMIEHKLEPSYQKPQDQFAFLHSMAAYLSIFQESIEANKLELVLDQRTPLSVVLDPEKILQSYSVEDLFIQTQEERKATVAFSTDNKQTLFIEVMYYKLQDTPTTISNGISVYQSFADTKVAKGELITGEISIISPEAQQSVVVIQPLIAGAEMYDEGVEQSTPWKVKSVGQKERWFYFTHLEKGETRIPFSWLSKHAGLFTTPPVYGYLADQPEIFATSLSSAIEIRNEQ